MKLAVSNIAWAAADDEPAYRLLADRGVPGLEIAATRIWSELAGSRLPLPAPSKPTCHFSDYL